MALHKHDRLGLHDATKKRNQLNKPANLSFADVLLGIACLGRSACSFILFVCSLAGRSKRK
jgi:hypothetical protein